MTDRPPRVSKSNYRRAEIYLPHNAQKHVFRAGVEPNWIEGGDSFWYRVTAPEGKQFILVDPEGRTRRAVFDHVRLAASLSLATGEAFEHTDLPFDNISLYGSSAVEFTVSGELWRCELQTYECTQVRKTREGESVSPDGRWAAFVRDHDLWLRCLETDEEYRLTTDGEEDSAYASRPGACLSAVTDRLRGTTAEPALKWSPDSKRILTHRLDERRVEKTCLLQSVPTGGGYRPVPHFYRYPLPGDGHVATAHMLVVDVQTREVTEIDAEPLLATVRPPTENDLAWWNEAGDQVNMVRLHRGHSRVSLELADAATGAARVLLEEESSTNVAPFFSTSDRPAVAVLNRGEEVLWFSKADGWGHLYLYDGGTGEIRRQVTSGAWSVREIIHVDEQDRIVYFLAGGREEGRDPYYRHLYRVGLDGGPCELLTPEDADHQVTASPTGRFFTDTFSRVDTAPASRVLNRDGEEILFLELADLSRLEEIGWKPPERFSVKARDGVTDLYGLIYRPTDFDPERKYAVIDAIYPGPQVIQTPKSFPSDQMAAHRFWSPQSVAELGFVVVTIDGMGTPYRSRAFIEKAYGGRFGEAGGLEDHVAGIRQLARTHRYMDLDRVGIYGHSGGGYASTRAMLKFPDFYKVAVSSAGNHDQRGYLAHWGEFWIGLPADDRYDDQSNVDLAENLRGKLLLAHGDMDDNVHPALTLQLVHALIEANRDFDLLILPGRNHALMDLTKGADAPEVRGDPYFTRRLWDYFVRHLLGAEPPSYRVGGVKGS
ncbi:MAG: DPP IV N-terminal domain-containing protein [Bacillota bacterium]